MNCQASVWLMWLGRHPKVWWVVVLGCVAIVVILTARGYTGVLDLLTSIVALMVAIYMVIFEVTSNPPQ